MQYNKNINKEWYTKNDILNEYPIGISTYKKRIKILSDSSYSPYTKLIRKEFPHNNLNERIIHYSLLDELFGTIRVPVKADSEKVFKWVKNNNWSWFCNIVPGHASPIDLKWKMDYFFKQLKKTGGAENEIVIFYTIEKNTEDEYFHSHFLIKGKDGEIDKKSLFRLLEDVCEKNTKNETRIYVKKYNKVLFNSSGSEYSAKDFSIGYDILK